MLQNICSYSECGRYCKNSGVEFSIDYKNKFSDDFSVSLGYNVAFLENLILEVNNGRFWIY
jgi:hypothetical protein